MRLICADHVRIEENGVCMIACKPHHDPQAQVHMHGHVQSITADGRACMTLMMSVDTRCTCFCRDCSHLPVVILAEVLQALLHAAHQLWLAAIVL